MFILIFLALSHPTDTLPINYDFQQEGLVIVMGEDLSSRPSLSLQYQGSQSIDFSDSGQEADAKKDDGIFTAFYPLPLAQRKEAFAHITISMADTEIWADQIPIAKQRKQLFLKILYQGGRAVVKVDSFDTDQKPREEKAPPMPQQKKKTSVIIKNTETTPNSWFLKPAFLSFLSSLLFFGLGFFFGQQNNRAKLSLKTTGPLVPLLQTIQTIQNNDCGEELLRKIQKRTAQQPVLLLSKQQYPWLKETIPNLFLLPQEHLVSFSQLISVIRNLPDDFIVIIDQYKDIEVIDKSENRTELIRELFQLFPHRSFLILDSDSTHEQ